MKKILKLILLSTVTILVNSSIISCKEDSINIGDNIVGNDGVGDTVSLDLIAYNTYYDSLRSDSKLLQNALLGAYSEPIFGETKAGLVAQIRPTNSVSFGTNAKVDSVFLHIPVYYKADSIITDSINLSRPNLSPQNNDTILVRKIYKVDSIYGGSTSTKNNLQVRDINTVLYKDSIYYSNNPNNKIDINSTILGSAQIGKTVENISIIVKGENTVIHTEPIGYKIPLSKSYFDQKIIANEKTGYLDDYASFLRNVIKGFAISTDTTNGFLVTVNPGEVLVNMYYSFDTTSDGKTVRRSSSYNLNSYNSWSSTAGSNVQVSLLEHKNKGAEFVRNYENADKINGSEKLFLNGADGTKIAIKFIKDQINNLKTKKESENWTIIGAKINFYINESYPFKKSNYITAWNNYKENGNYVNKLFADVTNFNNSYPNSVHFNPPIGKNNFYTIDLTKYIKDIVEKNISYEDETMEVVMGNFLLSTSDNSVIYSTNPFFNNRVANPHRVVFYGNKSLDTSKKLKLIVYYTRK